MLKNFSSHYSVESMYFTIARKVMPKVSHHQVRDFIKEYIPYVKGAMVEITSNDATMTLFTLSLENKDICEYFLEKAAEKDMEVVLDEKKDGTFKLAIMSCGSKTKDSKDSINTFLKVLLKDADGSGD